MKGLQQLINQLCPNGVEWKTLGEVAKLERGVVISKEYLRDNAGDYPVYSSQTENNGEFGRINTYRYDGTYVTWTTDGAYAGTVFRRYGKFNITNVCGLINILDKDCIDVNYLYYILSITTKKYVNEGMGNPKLMSNVMAKVKIPLPPLAIQSRIVEILDHFTNLTANLTAELNLRRKQFEHYREKLLSLDGVEGVEWKKLGEVAENLDSKRKPITSSNRVSGDIPYYGASGIVDYVDGFIFDGDYLLISEDGANLLSRNTPIAFSISGKTWVNNHAHILYFEKQFCRKFVEYYINKIDLTPYISDGAQPKLNQANLNRISIPYPSEDTQHSIVSILDKFTALIENIEKELALRQKQYEYYREELLRFGG